MKKINNTLLKVNLFNKYNIGSYFSDNPIEDFSLLSFEKGEFLAMPGDYLDHLYFLVLGKLKVYASKENGQSLLFKLSTPLSVIGDIEFLDKDPCASNIEFLKDSYMLAIPLTTLNSKYDGDIVFYKKICLELGEKLRYSSFLSRSKYLYPLENRLAEYLVFLSDQNYNVSNLNLSETADLLGTSYRHLLRVLQSFESKEIIIRTNKNIHLENIIYLKNLSKDIFY